MLYHGAAHCDGAPHTTCCTCDVRTLQTSPSLFHQVMLGATIGIARPAAVTWLNSDLFTIFLGFLMLSMGLTLTVEDFKKVHC